ncbi:hypothetical protein ACIBSV_10850 [Embleya sp. NPDC050154]|uniref:hypothetical protein n=1 Tax=unclassified Embleya TaxID=2699296 RepID=UPI00378C96E5
MRTGRPDRGRIPLIDAGATARIQGPDHRHCRDVVRAHLETEEPRLCCRGARANVHASDMLLQFPNGRETSVSERSPRRTTVSGTRVRQ